MFNSEKRTHRKKRKLLLLLLLEKKKKGKFFFSYRGNVAKHKINYLLAIYIIHYLQIITVISQSNLTKFDHSNKTNYLYHSKYYNTYRHSIAKRSMVYSIIKYENKNDESNNNQKNR
jgi:hypothetical protein